MRQLAATLSLPKIANIRAQHRHRINLYGLRGPLIKHTIGGANSSDLMLDAPVFNVVVGCKFETWKEPI